MSKGLIIAAVALIVAIGLVFFAYKSGNTPPKLAQNLLADQENFGDNQGGLENDLDPLSIDALRAGSYPGSDIAIEQDLGLTGNYHKYVASYKSEGLKIYALLTIPQGNPPSNGWPAIIFNHGYIPPAQYQTTERYVSYVDGFATNGYVVFKPDFRGHGNSEGEPSGAYGSSDYTIDALNAVASIKKFKDVDANRIGMWGHSMGGFITLRSMVVSSDIKAGVIWAGVVASYEDLLNNWRRRSPFPSPSGARRWRQTLTEKYGTPQQNPSFWNSISANSYLSDISGPLQLHHGTADQSVPTDFSEKLASDLKNQGKTAQIYTYEGDDHNLSANFNTAMQRSVNFFDIYLK